MCMWKAAAYTNVRQKVFFCNRKMKPLVGDFVEIEVLDEEERTGNMEEILPRKSELIRPAVANIDQAMVIFAAAKPKPNLSLLDRFLISMEQRQVPSLICFNKIDEASGRRTSAVKRDLQWLWQQAVVHQRQT